MNVKEPKDLAQKVTIMLKSIDLDESFGTPEFAAAHLRHVLLDKDTALSNFDSGADWAQHVVDNWPKPPKEPNLFVKFVRWYQGLTDGAKSDPTDP